MAIRSKLALAGMLASAALLLAACGSTRSGLIPEGNAIPLRSDFQAVSEAAQAGNGECSATERAIKGMERDFAALPSSVNPGLHAKLEEGVSNLRSQALITCERQTSTTTSTSSTTTTSTTTTSSTPTTTTTTTTSTTSEPTTSASYTYSETSTAPITPSETGGTEASSASTTAPGGAGLEEGESPPAQGGAAAGGIP